MIKKKLIGKLSTNEIEMLIKNCDEIIESVSDSELIYASNQNYDTVFNDFMSALITKHVILYGAKNRIIRQIKLDDYDENNSMLKINDLIIPLPKNMASQMGRFKKLRTVIASEIPYFFVCKIKNQIVQFPQRAISATMGSVMKMCFNTYDMNPVRQYAILEMLRVELEKADIVKLSGCSDEAYTIYYEKFIKTADFDVKKRDLELLNNYLMEICGKDF